MVTLWPHQERGLSELRVGFGRGQRRGVLVLPTGGGKTFAAATMAGGSVEKGKRAVFIADRRVLVKQAAQAFHKVGLPCGIVMRDAGPDWYDPAAPVQVVSKDSLVSWLKRPDWTPPAAELVITDECHRSSGQSWDFLRAVYPDAWEVGLSATPVFPNGLGLGERYQFLVNPTTYAELIAAGVLVAPECFAPGSKVEGKSGRKPTRASMVGDAVFWWQKFAAGARTFVFATSVAHSMALRDEFRKAGVRAEHIDAQTEDGERDRVLSNLASGQVTVVCNCAVLRYGVDVPAVECAQILAPMTSVVDYRQSVGRVLRAAPGKSRAVVIDHAGAVLYHGFPHADLPWTLDGETDHAAVQRKRMKDGEAPLPVCCPECHTLFSGSRTCPGCGWVPKRAPRAKATRAGTLTRVAEDAKVRELTPEEMNRAWRQALAVAANRGMRVSAAAAIFRKATQAWPESVAGLEPMPPTRADWSRPASEVFPQFVRSR